MGRGCTGPAEERRRQGQGPMIAHTFVWFILIHFHFYFGVYPYQFLWVSIGLTTDRVSPKLLPVREITLTNKLVTCVLSGPCDTKALCLFWLKTILPNIRLETTQSWLSSTKAGSWWLLLKALRKQDQDDFRWKLYESRMTFVQSSVKAFQKARKSRQY